jgi:hypothetical protein
MSNPFFDGLLSLAKADEEVALIPPAITFLNAWLAAKDGIGRAAAVAQLEGNVLEAQATVGPALLAQVVPQANTALQALLAQAQATVANPPKL